MKVIGKLKEVLIRLASNPQVHFIIDIIVADIPEAYGYFLAEIVLKNSKDSLQQTGHIYGYLIMVARTRSELIENAI